MRTSSISENLFLSSVHFLSFHGSNLTFQNINNLEWNVGLSIFTTATPVSASIEI